MLSRLTGWPERLEEFLAANRTRKFKYGQWDCCLFVCDAIQAMTGTDIATVFGRGYKTRAEAITLAREFGFAPSVQSIAEHVAVLYGMPEVEVLRAARGDMALIRRARDYSLGLVAMNGTELLIALKCGFGPVPLNRAVRAWRV